VVGYTRTARNAAAPKKSVAGSDDNGTRVISGIAAGPTSSSLPLKMHDEGDYDPKRWIERTGWKIDSLMKE
jgi:hypothetical protein